MSEHHKTIPVQVWADIDEGVAEMVRYLNTISGVRTHASCQGTIGEGGPAPYRAQVMATWPPEVFARLSQEFDVTLEGDNWGYLHPRASPDAGSRKPALDPAAVEIWQSIETAPKDGTKIIFFSADRGLPGPGEAVWDVESKPGYWWAYGAGGMLCYPTHWMPLPSPPRALAGKEGA